MGGVNSLDALVSVYQTGIRVKKWYCSKYINTVDMLKSVLFKVFKTVNADGKMDFLVFTRRVAMHYLKVAKVRRQLPPDIIYPRQRSWKGNASVPENERNHGNHFFEKCKFNHSMLS